MLQTQRLSKPHSLKFNAESLGIWGLHGYAHYCRSGRPIPCKQKLACLCRKLLESREFQVLSKSRHNVWLNGVLLRSIHLRLVLMSARTKGLSDSLRLCVSKSCTVKEILSAFWYLPFRETSDMDSNNEHY